MLDYRTTYTVRPRLGAVERKGTPITEEQYASAWAATAKAEGHRKGLPTMVEKPEPKKPVFCKRIAQAKTTESKVIEILTRGPAMRSKIAAEIGMSPQGVKEAIKRLRGKGYEIDYRGPHNAGRYHLEAEPMTDRIEALKKLKARLEAGSGGYSFKDLRAAGFHNHSRLFVEANAKGSLDAARELHEALLPGWCVVDLSQNGRVAGHPWGIRLEKWDASVGHASAVSDAGWGGDGTPDGNPARAWLLAILSALIAIEEQSQ